MTNERMRRAALFISTLAVAVLVGPACTSTEEDLCDAKCECEGCSDVGYDACVAEYDGDLREAEHRGCVDLYDELAECRLATGICKGGEFDTACGPEKDRLKNCTDPKN